MLMQPFLDLLIRSRLLSAEQIQHLWRTWQVKEGPRSEDPTRFARWLTAEQYLTKYQATLLLQGMADYFFLGEYVILDRIGKGRMAGVYQARHRLGHIVAVKVLPPSKAQDPLLLGRFRREARIATRLKHPHVVLTFHSGRQGEVLHYIVMEYLEGETLEEVLKRRGRLPPAEAGRLIQQALTGLQHIRDKGLIHRDLKPANLMLTPPLTPGDPDTTYHAKIKILDIGLGRELFDEHGVPGSGPQLTVGEALLGDPKYMAPEQARDAHQADIRSDIYSLGCVLFEALTGQPPFTDKTVARLVLRHAIDPVPSLASFVPDVPPALQAVFEIMLAKEPAQRFSTPAEAALALKRAIKEDTALRPRTAMDTVPDEYLRWVASMQKEEDEEPSPDRPAVPPPTAGRPRNSKMHVDLAAPATPPGKGRSSSTKHKTAASTGRPSAVRKPAAQPTEASGPPLPEAVVEEDGEALPPLSTVIIVCVIGLAVGVIAALLVRQYL